MIARALRRLDRDSRGATLIEFAIVSPVMITMMMGLGDMLYQEYAQSILNGAVQKAARDSGIQGGVANTAAIDAKVVAVIQQMAPKATGKATRLSYSNFTDDAPEPFTDSNGNGVRDPGECFTDVNGNGVWDANPGLSGQGGANDVTLYTMTVTYPRLFPVAGLLGWSTVATITASTLLKNQPYATQNAPTPKQICT